MEGAVNGSLPGKGGTAWRRQVRKQRKNAMVKEGAVGWRLMKQRYRGSTDVTYNRRRTRREERREERGRHAAIGEPPQRDKD